MHPDDDPVIKAASVALAALPEALSSSLKIVPHVNGQLCRADTDLELIGLFLSVDVDIVRRVFAEIAWPIERDEQGKMVSHAMSTEGKQGFESRKAFEKRAHFIREVLTRAGNEVLHEQILRMLPPFKEGKKWPTK